MPPSDLPARFDVVGLGNAIVDVLAPVEPGFLDAHSLVAGSMSLVGLEAAASLYAAMPPGQETSGGSAANTCAVAAALGARVAYLGKVAEDALGEVFRRDLAAIGVHFPSRPLAGGAPTGRCIVAVTPDGQRTMSTFLGASVAFAPDDVDTALIGEASVIYLEGYLFDPPPAQAAFRAAAAAAHAAGRAVALSLSDPFCVLRHRDAFRGLVREHVDLLFANEAEVCALYETTSFDAAAEAVSAEVRLAALTRGPAGSVVLSEGERVVSPASAALVCDTTGAGDAYAAGFLAARAAGQGLAACASLGGRAAAEIIGQLGARPVPGFRDRVAGG